MGTIERLHWTELAARPDADVDVNRHVLDAGRVAHDHDFFEIALVLGGRATHVTVRGRRAVGRGDAIALRAGAWHAFEDCRALEVVNCCFRPRMLERELLWLADEPRLRFLLWPTAGAGAVHVGLSERALADADAALGRIEANGGAAAPRPYAVAQLVLLLCALGEHLGPGDLRSAERLAAAPAAVGACLSLMAADLARPWTVDALAAGVAVSPAHLSRLFRRAVGHGPMTHLTALRAEAAAARLLRTDDPVSLVGSAVGWGDPNYFARRFRAHFGVSPTAFRRRA